MKTVIIDEGTYIECPKHHVYNSSKIGVDIITLHDNIKNSNKYTNFYIIERNENVILNVPFNKFEVLEFPNYKVLLFKDIDIVTYMDTNKDFIIACNDIITPYHIEEINDLVERCSKYYYEVVRKDMLLINPIVNKDVSKLTVTELKETSKLIKEELKYGIS